MQLRFLRHPIKSAKGYLQYRRDKIRAMQNFLDAPDFDRFSRRIGLALFPFTCFICGGYMGNYADKRIQKSLSNRQRGGTSSPSPAAPADSLLSPPNAT